jgi:hypothetical protein
MRAAALIGALSVLALGPATATAAPAVDKERFRVEVKGVQTTAWEYDAPGGGLCNPSESGEGTEVVRFATARPQLLKATRFGPTYVHFGNGNFRGDLTAGTVGVTARARITRHSMSVEGPLAPGCVDPDGSATRPPDCGARRDSLDLMLAYQPGAGRGPGGVVLRNHIVPSPAEPFRNCGANGVYFPTLLDHDSRGRPIASAWPVDEVFDRGVGKTILIGRGRKVSQDATSKQVSTIRWEATLRRLPANQKRSSR